MVVGVGWYQPLCRDPLVVVVAVLGLVISTVVSSTKVGDSEIEKGNAENARHENNAMGRTGFSTAGAGCFCVSWR